MREPGHRTRRGPLSIHELSATRDSGPAPLDTIGMKKFHDPVSSGILRVVDMSEHIVEKCVAAYGAGPRRWADE